jgi:chemotaxis protein histidine kinase CheA
MDDCEEIVKEFLAESHENLDRLDRDLVELEKHPSDREILASIFRTIHTIKGTSGFLGFGKLEAVAHVGESLLARLRDGQLGLTPERTTALLKMVDAVRQMLAEIQATGRDGDADHSALVADLTRLQQEVASGVTAEKQAASPEPCQPAEIRGMAPPLQINPAEDSTTASPAAAAAEERGGTLPAEQRPREATRESIRVDVGLLDKLMNLVGELVLARNQILQFTRTTGETNLVTTGQRLNLIATELQESVMKTRMQPIGSIWSRFPRTVRDVALACGKQVRIEMEGQETELDKTLIEAIKDPMTHLVRNAVDHGVERAEVRQAAGKDPEGVLRLRAYHEGGQVNIEISDDGAGLNLKRVVEKALQKGAITAEQAARLSDREAANLIFLPGLSTAEKVTNVSGRGVGMDVVKTNIERIGGTVDLQSVAGEGTTVKVKIPLTLAIVPALIVSSGGQRFAIPQVSLLELVGLEGEDARKRIEMIHGTPVYRLRGSLLPLVSLKDLLGQRGSKTGSENSRTLLDFTEARRKHSAWIDRLGKMLNGQGSITLEEAGSHEHCALGTWLYGGALDDHAGVAEFEQLETTHKHFHDLVRGIVAHKLEGNHAQAERDLAPAAAVSGKIIELLNAAEKRVLERNRVSIVVLQADGQKFGLVVDEISDTEEIVVKPLGKHLKNVSVFAGATIMGDGKVALILDVLGLAQHAHVINEARDRSPAAESDESKRDLEAARGQERRTVLLFRLGEGGAMAIDLGAVARLEEFPSESIERAGGQETVQYRGQIMPLVRLAETLGGTAEGGGERTGPLQVIVVYGGQGRNAGLIVDQILDIADESFALDRQTARAGVAGSAVIQQRITDLVDVTGVLATVPMMQTQQSAAAGA